MSEKINDKGIFDQINSPETLRQEVEKKLVPTDPALFEPYKQLALPIEQIYLSQPGEDYTLRVRAELTTDGPAYTATLKDGGIMTPHGLSRMEVEVPIARETFEWYQRNDSYPRVKKLRATLMPGVTIDWIDGVELPLVELEHTAGSEETATFYDDYQHVLTNVTGDHAYDNGSIAYSQFEGTFEQPTELSASDIVDEMIAHLQIGKSQVVVGISGMSGSGKSTLATDVERELVARYGTQLPAPIRISTDDYHVGKTRLESTYGAPWTNWDAPEVYDTRALANDLARLRRGEQINQRHFDFALEETVIDDILEPSPLVIVEGIYAGSPDLTTMRDLHFHMPTPLATTIGRDILRLTNSGRPNNSINTPEDRLRYQLETALPTYRAQERPRRNTWSASARTIGKVAWLSQSESADLRP